MFRVRTVINYFLFCILFIVFHLPGISAGLYCHGVHYRLLCALLYVWHQKHWHLVHVDTSKANLTCVIFFSFHVNNISIFTSLWHKEMSKCLLNLKKVFKLRSMLFKCCNIILNSFCFKNFWRSIVKNLYLPRLRCTRSVHAALVHRGCLCSAWFSCLSSWQSTLCCMSWRPNTHHLAVSTMWVFFKLLTVNCN